MDLSAKNVYEGVDVTQELHMIIYCGDGHYFYLRLVDEAIKTSIMSSRMGLGWKSSDSCMALRLWLSGKFDSVRWKMGGTIGRPAETDMESESALAAAMEARSEPPATAPASTPHNTVIYQHLNSLKDIQALRQTMGPDEIRGVIVGMGQCEDFNFTKIDLIFLCPGNNSILVDFTVPSNSEDIGAISFSSLTEYSGKSKVEVLIEHPELILDHSGRRLVDSINSEFAQFKSCIRPGVWLGYSPTYWYTTAMWRSWKYSTDNFECRFEQDQFDEPSETHQIAVRTSHDSLDYIYRLVYASHNGIKITLNIICNLPLNYSIIFNSGLSTSLYEGDGFCRHSKKYVSFGNFTYSGIHGTQGMSSAVLRELEQRR